MSDAIDVGSTGRIPGVIDPGASMTRLLAVSVLALAVAAACAPITPVATPAATPDTATVAPAQSEDARLHAWFERMYEEDCSAVRSR